jgi:hypothetical protein
MVGDHLAHRGLAVGQLGVAVELVAPVDHLVADPGRGRVEALVEVMGGTDSAVR